MIDEINRLQLISFLNVILIVILFVFFLYILFNFMLYTMHVSNKLSDLENKESYNKEKILISSSNANTTIFYEYIFRFLK